MEDYQTTTKTSVTAVYRKGAKPQRKRKVNSIDKTLRTLAPLRLRGEKLVGCS